MIRAGRLRQLRDIWDVPRDLALRRYPAFVTGGELPRGHVPVFCFHSLDPESFGRKLDPLARNHYVTLSSAEYLAHLRGERAAPERTAGYALQDAKRFGAGDEIAGQERLRDVEHGEAFDCRGMVDAQPVRHPGAAIMAREPEPREAERAQIVGKRSGAVARYITTTLALRAFSISASFSDFSTVFSHPARKLSSLPSFAVAPRMSASNLAMVGSAFAGETFEVVGADAPTVSDAQTSAASQGRGSVRSLWPHGDTSSA